MTEQRLDMASEPPAGRTRLLNVTTVAIGAAFLAVGSWATYFAPLRNDQYQLIHLGQTVYRGGRMYVDAWENKPPGIAWINALALTISGGRPIGPWLMPAATAVVVLGLVWFAASRLYGLRTGRRTVLIAALVYSLREYDAPSINPDFYASIFELAASAAWLMGCIPMDRRGEPAERRSPAWLLASGLLWAAAASVKQVGCAGLIAVTLTMTLALVVRRVDRRRRLSEPAILWTGFVLGLGAVVGALAWQGTLGEAWKAVVTFNRGIARWDALLATLSGNGRIRIDLASLAAFLWLGGVGVAVGIFAERPARPASRIIPTMLLWWVAAAVFALIGPSGSMRYWQATFPPTVWLAGLGVHYVQEAQERLDRHHRIAFIAVGVTALYLLMRPMLYEIRADLAASYTASIERPNERDRLVEIGRTVAERIAPDNPIYVWGYHAGVYVHADRSAASRFTYPRSAAQMDEILQTLEQRRAAMILVSDHAPEFAAFCDEPCRRRFDDVLNGYVPSTAIGPYEVWTRPPAVPAGSADGSTKPAPVNASRRRPHDGHDPHG